MTRWTPADSMFQLLQRVSVGILGGVEYVFHHCISMFAIILAVTSGQSQFYIFMVLLSEATTPFVNLRWYLDTSGQKSSKLYTCNGIALFLGWLVARVLLFIYFFVHMFLHFDQVKQVFPLGFYSLLTIPPALGVMNLLWFWKITKGLIKTLSKARRRE
ncbi:PREDICTED: transmembrane protein 56 [Tarenaya hassleriana]|uniref:transmembrane protein 56 n=1 Tax=Tarenaya hassleriana TaxID=28532 RepID=UPI00053C4C47|nr:PREDICTED: transmembrane protein 56 [Tarenaya hassleriana]